MCSRGLIPGPIEGVCDGVSSHAPFEFAGERPLHYENTEVEDIYARWDTIVPAELLEGLEAMVEALLVSPPESEQKLTKAMAPLRKKYKIAPRKAQILHAYRGMVADGRVAARSTMLEEVLTTKASKSQSGVLVVTVITSPYPSVGGGKPQKFSCEWNCYYCPNQPGQPRSYLRDEPAVLRANQNRFDAVMQFTERCATLAQNGHPVDKVELLVLGGTWASYPAEYREAFCRDLYFAANTFWERCKRERFSLAVEQNLNESASTKIIGLTLETRPDTITVAELRLLRSYGCTRVQLGVQHTDEAVLAKVNRGHGRVATAVALQLLKDACYKVDIHLMPNLPGASVEIDKQMFDAVLTDPLLQADQWKIYPCETVPWTVIKKWFDEGSYVPYDEAALTEVLLYGKSRVHPWIRLNRVVRDIPSNYIFGGVDAPNMREDVLVAMRRLGLRCKCIRCREVGDIGGLNQVDLRSVDERCAAKLREVAAAAQPLEDTAESPPSPAVESGAHGTHGANGAPPLPATRAQNMRSTRNQRAAFRKGGEAAVAKSVARSRANRDGIRARREGERLALDAVLVRREYEASGGLEHFLSFETPDLATIFGFLRLRLAEGAGAGAFPSLRDCALIRELHVYGQLVRAATAAPNGSSEMSGAAIVGDDGQQHSGFGRRLMADAERIARAAGFRKIAVISGVGTRQYYYKLGFKLDPDGDYLVKQLPYRPSSQLLVALSLLLYTAIIALALAYSRCAPTHLSLAALARLALQC